MGSVTIRTYNGTILQRQTARHVARWFIRTRLSRSSRNIHLNINFSDHMEHDVYGLARWNQGRSSYRSNSYSIIINSNVRANRHLIETVIHELVHVEQMATNALRYFQRDTETYQTFWKGKLTANELPYDRHPWETEAYRLEKTLTRLYLKSGR